MNDTGDWSSGRKTIIARIQAAEALTDIGEAMSLIQARLGFSYYKLFVGRPLSSTRLRDQLLLYNHPEAFFERIGSTGIRFQSPDDLFRPAENLTFTWTIDLLDQAYEEPQLGALRQVLVDYGLLMGVYFSLHAVEGPNRILAFQGDRPPLSPAEMEDFSLLAFQLLHRVYTIEKRLGGWAVGVSALDMTCLSLAASGLDSAAIAQQMGFSTRTVHYLIASICQKLGVDTFEHAVTEALRRGFIT
ncbi:LuxR family transcriptional regulator [Pseudomonas sp. R2.Fl]|nr:LuxR family transcriptional regulator [Pseudomonas sp. R2.Fl]